MRTFDNTVKAIEVFDQGAGARQAAWDAVTSEAEILACVKADQDAISLVRLAFYEDTKDINLKENCMLVDIDFMRRMANTTQEQV